MRTRVTLAALASVLAALAFASSAQAAGTSASFAGSTAIVNFDGNNDTITIAGSGGNLTHGVTGGSFASNADWDTVAGGVQTAPANGTIVVIVNAGGGNDTIGFEATTANALFVNYNGEDGNDTITGAPDGDVLSGGNGDDLVTGAPGADDMDGGTGNDTLIWNQGDGSDVIDGDAGNDTTQVNGSTGDETFTINPNAGRIDFDRTSAGAFSLNAATENLDLNANGGNDTITGAAGLAPITLLALGGERGDDSITGGDGADLIEGGSGVDNLVGGAGQDRVVGEPGNDNLNGGDGGDTTVWNNGDGSDVIEGNAGSDTVEVNGSTTGDDQFVVQPLAGRVRLDRINLVLFNLSIGTSEGIDIRGLAGNDSLETLDGLAPFSVLAQGGDGNDTLAGANGAETLLGGDGNDALDGKLGSDLLHGDAGDDALALRDGIADVGRCGAGADSAVADHVGLDTLFDCETADLSPAPVVTEPDPEPTDPGGDDPPPAAEPQAPSAADGKVKVKNGRALIALECAASATAGCSGELSLLTPKPVKLGGVQAIAILGRQDFSLAAGEEETLRVKLAKGADKLVKKGKITVEAEIDL